MKFFPIFLVLTWDKIKDQILSNFNNSLHVQILCNFFQKKISFFIIVKKHLENVNRWKQLCFVLLYNKAAM